MKGERAFLDTNVLLYAFNPDDARSASAQQLIAPGAVISVQVLNEFVSVARRKLRLPWTEILPALSAIALVIPEPKSVTSGIHRVAIDLSLAHGYHIYDSLIIASALEAGCTVLYSEDLQDGHVEGLTIRNPFR
jgi:predicted nucleic acid-binding protein